MLAWLWNLLRWRSGDRQIFVYWDGRKYRRIDPMVAWYALHDHPTYHDERHPAGVDAGDRESMDITCQAVRDVFGVTDYDGETRTGLTTLEQLGLMALFLGYLSGLKKTDESTPISASSTEDSISTESAEPITPVTSASG